MSTAISTVFVSNAVYIKNEKPVIASLKIAEIFGKRHGNVIRDIESLQVPDAWFKLNFELIQIDVDLGQGRTRKAKAYLITKDGYMILAMGFTGKKAMQFKIILIEAFNRMEEQIRSVPEPRQLPAGNALGCIEYMGYRVLPNVAIAALFRTSTTTPLNYLKKHPHLFSNGYDYFVIDKDEIKNLVSVYPDSPWLCNSSRSLVLWGKTGARTLVTLMQNKHASHVYSQLERTYFNTESAPAQQQLEFAPVAKSQPFTYPANPNGIRYSINDMSDSSVTVTPCLEAFLEQLGEDRNNNVSGLRQELNFLGSALKRFAGWYCQIANLPNTYTILETKDMCNKWTTPYRTIGGEVVSHTY